MGQIGRVQIGRDSVWYSSGVMLRSPSFHCVPQ